MLKSPAFSTSFLESRMIQKLKSRKSRIKSGFFAFLLAERIIFGKKTQKSQVSLLRCLTFSLVCGRIWQRGAPAGPPAVRVVGRVRASGTQATSRPRRQPRPSPSALLLGFPIRSPLSPTAPIPSSTRNAPGLAFFWLNRVRFSLFRWFLGAKFLSWFLCILPHSGHRLKPSVIPCRREVSFLT